MAELIQNEFTMVEMGDIGDVGDGAEAEKNSCVLVIGSTGTNLYMTEQRNNIFEKRLLVLVEVVLRSSRRSRLVSDRNRYFDFWPKPNIRQPKTTGFRPNIWQFL
jgi:hypothetical protein